MNEEELTEWKGIAQFLNSTGDDEKAEVFRDLGREAMDEFGDVGDYIWKLPRFIEQETAREKDKLEAYVPLTDDLEANKKVIYWRKQRWDHESKKLLQLFPNLIATGNLYSCLAIFEAYCLRLSRLIERRSNLLVKDAKGRGVSKIFSFFKSAGIHHFDLAFVHQVEAALMVRNCLIHAEGLLSWDKDEKSLRRIINKGVFLSPNHQARRKKLNDVPDEVIIVSDEIGERVKISNDYPFVVMTYARGYLLSALQEAHQIYASTAAR
jgi:hypothetical protein